MAWAVSRRLRLVSLGSLVSQAGIDADTCKTIGVKGERRGVALWKIK